MNKSGPIRIVHITSAHHPDDVRIFVKQARSLAACGYDVHLVAPATDKFAADQTIDGVRLHVVPRLAGRAQRMVRTAARVVRLAIGLRPALVHLHDPELIPWIVPLRLLGIRVVFDAHEDLASQVLTKPWIAPTLRRMVAAFARMLEALVAWGAHAVVTATPRIAEIYPAHKTVVVRNLPIAAEIDVPSDAGSNVAPVFDVVFVGGVSEIRGWEPMVAAMTLLQERGRTIQLGIVGPVESEAIKARLSQKYPSAPVVYTGALPRNQALAILRQAKIGLLVFQPAPNHNEAIPNKMFEYLAAGVAIVATEFPLWRELLADCSQVVRFVDPARPEAIAEAIDAFLEHPVTDADKHQIRSLVREQYLWENEFLALRTCYKKLGIA